MLRRRRAKRGPPPLAALGILWVATAVGCGGCSPSYVLRAAYEETRILWSRKPIERVLAEDELPAEERGKLELVLEGRRFAAEDLGMDVGGAYGSLAEVPPGALLWVVSASDRLQLRAHTWWFPIVGDVTYKGFFHRNEAEAEARALEERGYDTYVRQSSAFSTLGWFDDPILSSWLASAPVPLVRLVIHELLHRTTYLAGQTSFNESFATFAGGAGAVEFFEHREGADSERAREAREDWDRDVARSQRWRDAIARLRQLYRAGEDGRRTDAEVLREREEIFSEFGSSKEINNAVILAHYAYWTHLDRFRCVLRESDGDLRAAIARIRDASEEDSAHPFQALGSCAPDPAGSDG